MIDPMLSSKEIRSNLVLVCGIERQMDELLGDWCQFQLLNNVRAVKKACRQGIPALLVLGICDQDSEILAHKIAEYIRLGLSSADSRIVVLVDPSFSLDQSSWDAQLNVSAFLSLTNESLTFNREILKKEMDSYRRMADVYKQHQLEVSLLMSITRFSDGQDSFDKVLKHFSRSLGDVCSSCLTMQIHIAGEEGTIENFNSGHLISESDLNMAFNLPELTHGLYKAITEKKPQVSIQIDDFDVSAISSKLNKDIAGYLAFPIITYTKVVKILFYLISSEDMATISVSRIDLISKAFEQLKILLERNQAEKQLKKQYLRLKNTLMELKLAKDQLLQKEKLASVGKLAAGIAHEVNNPLAYVISNVSSIDNYIDSILQLQNLHDELVTAIDSGNSEIEKALKKNIYELREESDMSFILSDIRSVVTDSKEGLSRVKEIITDLQSFYDYDSKSSNACDINDIVEKTLKLLRYELEGIDIEVQRSDHSKILEQGNKIQQILDALIKNSADSLRSTNKVDKTLYIKAMSSETQLEFSVRDNGLGIEEGIKSKIFDPFFTTKAVNEGAGLGLSLAYNLVNQLNGGITLETVAGEYAEFCVTIPLGI